MGASLPSPVPTGRHSAASTPPSPHCCASTGRRNRRIPSLGHGSCQFISPNPQPRQRLRRPSRAAGNGLRVWPVCHEQDAARPGYLRPRSDFLLFPARLNSLPTPTSPLAMGDSKPIKTPLPPALETSASNSSLSAMLIVVCAIYFLRIPVVIIA